MTQPLRSEFARYLRTETVGGTILLAAAAIALVWANSPWSDVYESLQNWQIGPESLHLHLSLNDWAQDGLLAVFFFVAGLELKRELVVGELADRHRATLPVIAAVGGVVVPALIAAAIGWGTPGMDRGWAIPVATDIAFALGVLALTGSRIPSSARVFLLSLAVVDDLLAILLIAVLFTASISLWWLLAALGAVAGYWFAQHARLTTPFLYVPLALFAWMALHNSGIHATLAGVALALATRVRRDPDEDEAPASRLEHRLQPLSAGFCVPVFAFFAAGVAVGAGLLSDLGTNPIALAVIAGLLIGKPVGIFGVSWLAIRLRVATRPANLGYRDMFALSVLGGIGFTVSLLIAELALENEPGLAVETAKAAVLSASLVASLVGSALLFRRGRVHQARQTMRPPAGHGAADAPRHVGSSGNRAESNDDDEPEGSSSDTP
ncbi:Na+/H+ antiporter NhaA [Aldersonia sp. NBC_00410]|uniref:Na+/H+ antiporter NhaA n=1 Tax=Aldersonia sp. NBC_00410 TaxID=2975954 RepID=UPI002259A5BE|nr:Na+/H+ antiporter NhaA [Aldersonia sp. NBC_00410]MCX5043159.1 Na+/H+ antiporter NhaA [Aldersonia sp. NBC_00410]